MSYKQIMTNAYRNDANEKVTRKLLTNDALFSKGWKPYLVPEVVKKRGKNLKRSKRADSVMLSPYSHNIMALVEYKRVGIDSSVGLDQAIDYSQADYFNVPLVFATNGIDFIMADRKHHTCKKNPMNLFPTPKQVFNIVTDFKYNKTYQLLKSFDFDSTSYGDTVIAPYPYQKKPVNNVCKAYANGRRHILIDMATGTGKTYVAFQVRYKLSMLKKYRNHKYHRHESFHCMYSGDRDVLINQPKKDKASFGKLHSIKTLNSKELKNKNINQSYQNLFETYQGLFGQSMRKTESNHGNFHGKRPYEYLTPGSLDLIIVDECHRGNDLINKAYHKELDYLAPKGSNTVVLEMSATPREEVGANYTYCGSPVFKYGLAKAVHQHVLVPPVYCNCLDQLNNKAKLNYDCPAVNEAVAKHIVHLERIHYKQYGKYFKALIVCGTIKQAGRINILIKNLGFSKCREIVGVSRDREDFIDEFRQANSAPYVVTTSNLLRTGVDIKPLKCIVLATHFGSLTDILQTIGRGTRRFAKKIAFLVLDYGNNYNLLSKSKDFVEAELGSCDSSQLDGILNKHFKKYQKHNQKKHQHQKLANVHINDGAISKYSPNPNLKQTSIHDLTKWRDYIQERYPNPFNLIDALCKKEKQNHRDSPYLDLFYDGLIPFNLYREINSKHKDIDSLDLVLKIGYNVRVRDQSKRLKMCLSNFKNNKLLSKLIIMMLKTPLSSIIEFMNTDTLSLPNISKFTGKTKLGILLTFKGQYRNDVLKIIKAMYKGDIYNA